MLLHMNQTLTFEEGVRQRPGMCLGSNDGKGIVNLICGLIKDCIDICKTDKILFLVLIHKDNVFSIEISSKMDLTPYVQHFTTNIKEFDNYHTKVLKVVASNLEISNSDNRLFILNGQLQSNSVLFLNAVHLALKLNFSLDPSVFKNTNVDYLCLSEKLLLIALLNRETEIVVKDTRKKHLNQNYYYFTQGVFYLFDRIKSEVLGEPEFEILYDDKIIDNKYQIALAYRTDWDHEPIITSFTNDVHTTNGGSLVAGIMDGLVLALNKYVRENNLSTYNIKRKKLLNGLIIVCSVRGKDLNYDGSFKEMLMTIEVKSQVKKLISKLVFNYINENKDKAYKFICRFDETQLSSKMY